MAYMNQERKAKLAPKIKEICKKYGVKASLSTDRYSLNLKIKQGKIDFISNYNESIKDDLSAQLATKHLQVNPYHYQSHFTGNARKFLTEAIQAMNNGNHDNSDIQTDYFDVGWYIHVDIGQWDKPYEVV